jgi:hypothetical protein
MDAFWLEFGRRCARLPCASVLSENMPVPPAFRQLSDAFGVNNDGRAMRDLPMPELIEALLGSGVGITMLDLDPAPTPIQHHGDVLCGFVLARGEPPCELRWHRCGDGAEIDAALRVPLFPGRFSFALGGRLPLALIGGAGRHRAPLLALAGRHAGRGRQAHRRPALGLVARRRRHSARCPGAANYAP